MFKNRKLIFLSALLMLIVLIGCASAADVNDIQQATEGSAGEIITDEVSSAGIDDNSGLEELENENVLTNSLNIVNNKDTTEDPSLLSSEANVVYGEPIPGTFTELQALINDTPSGGVITLTRDYYYNSTVDHINGGIIINSEITIIGNGHTIDGNGQMRIFRIKGGHNTITDIRFVNGLANTYVSESSTLGPSYYYYNGGAIWMESSIGYNTISNCTFENNKITSAKFNTYALGGAIYCNGPNCTISDSTFINNSVNKYMGTGTGFVLVSSIGGAIYVTDGNTTICNSRFENNNASVGSAIGFIGKKTDVTGIVSNCTFENNTAYTESVIHLGNNKCKNILITNCSLANNIFESSVSGGGSIVISESYNCTVSDTIFMNHIASNGAGIGIRSGNGHTINNCTFINNSAVSDIKEDLSGAQYSLMPCRGGAIYIYRTTNYTITDCEFENNTALNAGGAIVIDQNLGTSTITSDYISNCSFVNNYVIDYNGDGGAIYFMTNKPSSNIHNSTFANNSARAGGAIYSTNNINEIINCSFIDNKVLSTNLTGERDKFNSQLIFTFEGNENYINAIYTENGQVNNFDNVDYWYDGYVANSDIDYPAKSIKEVGINITVEIYNSKGELIDNFTAMTNPNGQMIYDYSNIDYHGCTYKAYHQEDDYYTYIETSGFLDPAYNIIVLENKTHIYTIDECSDINITAVLVDYDTGDILNPEGIRLFFILPNGTEIEAARTDEGLWYAQSPYTQSGRYVISARIEPEEFTEHELDYSLYKIFTGTLSIITSPELSINKSADHSSIGVNGLVNFTITITNSNLTDAYNINIWDELPRNLTFINASEGYSKQDTGDYLKVSWSLDSLPLGSTAVFWIVAKATEFGSFENVAYAHHPDIGDINDTATVNVVPVILKINKTSDVSQAYSGEVITFTINVTNIGQAIATNISVEDNLPITAIMVEGNKSYIIDFLGVNESRIFTIKVYSILSKYNLTNQVYASCNENRTAVRDNATVEILSSIGVEKSANATEVGIGELVNFTINVTNFNSFSNEFNVVDMFGEGFNFVDASEGYNYTSTDAGTYNLTSIQWNLTIPSKSSMILWVLANTTKKGTFSNNAIASTKYDIASDNVDVKVLPPQLSIEKTANVTYMGIGDLVNFTITVTNLDDLNDVNSLEVIDQLPKDLVLVDASEGYSERQSNYYTGVYWTVDNLPARSSISFWIIAKATASGVYPNLAYAYYPEIDNEVYDTATVKVDALSLNKTANVSVVGIGGLVNFTLNVTNHKNVDVFNVSIYDGLPKGFALVNASEGYFTEYGGNEYSVILIWENIIDRLTPGSSVSVWIVAEATELGYYTNLAEAVDQLGNEDFDTADVEVIDSVVNLTVEKTVDKTSVFIGEEVTYTITVTNNGPNDATNVRVVDHLSGPATVVLEKTSEGYADGKWIVPYIAAGNNVTLTLVVLATDNGTISNSAIVSCDENDTENEGDAPDVIVKPIVILTINKTADKSSALIGEEITYTINVTNKGPCIATNIIVSDVLPEGLELIDGNLNTNIVSLGVNEYYIIIIKVNSTINGNLTNEVSAYCLENSTVVKDDETVEVINPILTVRVISNNPEVSVGEPVSFTVIVTNEGDCDLSEINVVNYFPDGLIYTGFDGADWSKVSSSSTGVYGFGMLGAYTGDSEGDKFAYSNVLKPGESANYTLYFNTTKVGTFTVEAVANSNMTNGAYSNNTTVVSDKPSPSPTPTPQPDSNPNPSPTPDSIPNPAPDSSNVKHTISADSHTELMYKTGNPIFLLIVAVLACLPILRRKQ